MDLHGSRSSSSSSADLDRLDLSHNQGATTHQHLAFGKESNSLKLIKDTFTKYKFKKLKFEDKKYFARLHRLVAAKKKTATIGSSLQPVDSMAPGLYRSDDEDEQSDESDLDHFEFQESVKIKLLQIKVR